MHEVMIIGAGPAGMTAAVYAARKRLKTLLVSKDIGGQAIWSSKIENYMGYQFIEGAELMRKFDDQVKLFPIDQMIGEEVTALERSNGTFQVRTAGGETLQAQALILASGKHPRLLNVPGEERLRGRGVSYCATCDAPLFSGQAVAVVGGGNSALEAARDLISIADHVFLVSPTKITGDPLVFDRLKSASNFTAFLEAEVTEINGSKLVEGVKIRDRQSGRRDEVRVGGVFVEIGRVPASELAKDLTGVNQFGEIEVNRNCETAVPGLFAAGDVTDVLDKQIVIAAAEGAKAALQAHRYLQNLRYLQSLASTDKVA
ncbi:MAG: FAD-dependent oxidoreductase [Dehalococcoidia bacterium]|nr:FAD-dependent oxidoreductase [Dehalococcoidia bacterium]